MIEVTSCVSSGEHQTVANSVRMVLRPLHHQTPPSSGYRFRPSPPVGCGLPRRGQSNTDQPGRPVAVHLPQPSRTCLSFFLFNAVTSSAIGFRMSVQLFMANAFIVLPLPSIYPPALGLSNLGIS